MNTKKLSNEAENPALNKGVVSGSFPSTIECHCMATAHKYRKRIFINQLGQTVTRIFYRCENCRSRIHSDYIPELDSKTVDVFELLKNYRCYRQLILIKMELKKMTLEEIEKEAFVYIGNADENADIIPDGKIDEAANLMANFIHHLWEIDVVYEPSVYWR